jgi:inosine-uridine nucleoside N-ribohydrolase
VTDRRRLILVVDTGVDDALAIALALRHPGIGLEAVHTSFGNVALERVNRNTLRVLDWLGADHIPVMSGAARPRIGAAIDAAYWHGDDGLGGATLPESSRLAPPGAIDDLIARVLGAPGELTLVATGPLTNLALAVERQPSLVSAVREVVVMGGTVGLPGNATAVAEYNIVADPEAAAVVFSQAWPLTMVGLDVTRQVLLHQADVARLAENSATEAVLVWQVTQRLFEANRVGAISLHDPLAVAVALDPTLVTARAGRVFVETKGEYTRGQTIFDLRPRAPDASGENTRVALKVDADRFRRLFFETLGL